MTKCTTALGNVPGNSILVYMRVPAAKSELHISRVSSMLHVLLAAFIYRIGFGGVNYLTAICRVGFGGVNCLICSTCPNQLFPSCMRYLPSHRAFGVDVLCWGACVYCWTKSYELLV